MPNDARTGCRCWQVSPPIPHAGHCCFGDDPTPLDEIVVGEPPPCGHWEGVPKDYSQVEPPANYVVNKEEDQ